MTGGDSVLCLLARAVDKDGRIEFRSYGELKRTIGWKGSARQLKRNVEELYKDTDSNISFMSPRLRSYDPMWDGKPKSLIVLPSTWTMLSTLKDGPLSVPPSEVRSEFLARKFGFSWCEPLIDRLIEQGVIKKQASSGSKGKVYETLSCS